MKANDGLKCGFLSARNLVQNASPSQIPLFAADWTEANWSSRNCLWDALNAS